MHQQDPVFTGPCIGEGMSTRSGRHFLQIPGPSKSRIGVQKFSPTDSSARHRSSGLLTAGPRALLGRSDERLVLVSEMLL
jgi:hypothetical protein